MDELFKRSRKDLIPNQQTNTKNSTTLLGSLQTNLKRENVIKVIKSQSYEILKAQKVEVKKFKEGLHAIS